MYMLLMEADLTTLDLSSHQPAARPKTLRSWRAAWLKIHLWLGLALGLFLSIIGVTGSLLVFFHEIDEALNPKLRIVTAPAQGKAAWRPVDEIADAARKAIPVGSQLGFCYWPQRDDEAFLFYYQIKAPGSDGVETRHVFVDPYRAEVTGTRRWYAAGNPFDDAFVAFLFRLHYALLVRGTGDIAVGIIAILAFVSTVTGVVLWWPRNGKWRGAFTWKWPAKSERLNYDIHRLSGVFLLPVAIAVLLSGVYFNLPTQFRTVVELFSPLTNADKLRSAAPDGTPSVSLDDALEIVARRFPDGRVYALVPPQAPDSSVRIHQLFPVGWGIEGRRTIYIDRYKGDVLHVNDPLAGNGDGFVAWQWPLHSGYVFGWPGRIAVFLFGLSWPLIFVTGIIRWRQKRLARDAVALRRI
ncbi:PepSY-associated TM helix domain-containing protein [Methylosinus sporium]|uniref:PepSY-associated TM helix domain-containing protein n=1 Tax=Methylosinus sporium TaxID=428 RepID=UPI00383BF4CE